jgi:Zn-dependent protease
MGGSFKIGRFSGIDVRVHWTFFLLLAFFGFIGYQTSGSLVGALTAAVTIVALFFCVLLHEFGHSLVAQRLGLEIHSITLLPLGGVSNLESLPEKPADEVKITVAGPLVNVVLAPIFFGVGLLFGAVPRVPGDLFMSIGSVGQFFFYLGYLNVVLAVFNLLPAFPLDGGRILRALLSTRLGAVRATDISSAVGQLFAVAFFLIGLLGGNFLLALVAVFIYFGASGEAQMVREPGEDARPDRLGRHGYQAPHRNGYPLPHLRTGPRLCDPRLPGRLPRGGRERETGGHDHARRDHGRGPLPGEVLERP